MDPDFWNTTDNCSIREFKHRVYPAAYLLTFSVGLLGNLLSLVFFLNSCRAAASFSPVNVFMLNLLFSDLMMVCSLPFRAAYYLMDSHWAFGSVTCRVMSYVFYINMYGSIYFLAVLSVVRLVAIVKPFRYLHWQSSRRAWAASSAVWLVVSLASTPLLRAGPSRAESGRSRCLELDSSLLGTMIVLNRGVLVLGFVLPFAVISVCYVLVAWHLLKRRRGVSTRHSPANHRRSCSLVIIVLLIFLSCFMPYHVVRTLFLEAEMGVAGRGPGEACHYLRRLREAAVVTHCLASGNSCLDPLLFFFVGENFVRFWKQYTPKRRSCVMEARPVGT